jgi:hypothetical protein
VQALFTSVIAVAGTLLGACFTYFFQSQTAKQSSSQAKLARLRRELAEAITAFASSATVLRRAEYDRAKKRIKTPLADREEESQETYRLRADAWSAYYLYILFADPQADRDLLQEAKYIIELLRQIVAAPNTAEELQERDRDATEALEKFMKAANRRLRHFDRPTK